MPETAAIILGATGSVGKAVLAEVLGSTQFSRVIVVSRRPVEPPHSESAASATRNKLVERLVPDMQPQSLKQAVIDVLNELDLKAVGFSVLGVGAGTGKLTLAQHRAVDVDLNAAFAAGLKASGRVTHLAYMSAIGADSNARATGSGAPGMPRYARVKGEAEQAVRHQGPAVVSILRPSVIVGSANTPPALATAMSLVSFLLPANLRPIRATDIARAMVALAKAQPDTNAIYTYKQMMALSTGLSQAQ